MNKRIKIKARKKKGTLTKVRQKVKKGTTTATKKRRKKYKTSFNTYFIVFLQKKGRKNLPRMMSFQHQWHWMQKQRPHS